MADVLLVGQTPPPYHGQAVVTEMLFNHQWKDLKVIKLRLAYSDDIDEIGKVAIKKIFHLVATIWRTWVIALSEKPLAIYYLPASANAVPVARDIAFLLCVRWCFKKTILHFHAGGLPQYLDRAGILGYLAKKAYSKADLSIDVIETTPPTGSYFGSKANTSVRNGVNVNHLPRKNASNNNFNVLYVGVLNEGKGILEIVKTASALINKGYKANYKLVGDWASNEFRDEVKEKVNQLGLKENFEFTGPLAGDEKWQAFADADLFFFPSHYEAETFGMVLVEAMAFGLPLVTTEWRGIPLVVKGGDCAILCKTRATTEFVSAIENFIQDKSKREKMGRAARVHYEKNYTESRFTAGMENAFKSVLRNNKPE